MSKLTFYIRDDYIKKNGKSAIYIVLYINRKKVSINTKIECKPQDFDSKKGVIKGSSKKINDQNLIIKSCVNRINEIFFRYRLQHKTITPAILKDEYKNPTSFISFIAFMEHEIQEKKGLIEDSSIVQHYSALNKLKRFRRDVSFADITDKFIQDFDKWLKVKLKNEINTRQNTLKRLKTYINIAEKRGLIENNPFKHYRIKQVKSSYTYLNLQDLKKLEELYDSNKLPGNYKKVLRHFLFQCYTGLRFSDLKKITLDMISNRKLYFVPHKTKNQKRETIIIPLIKKAIILINDENPLRQFGSVFDTYAEQTTNSKLKEIVKAAKINKHITTHVGRHTFATLYYEETNDVASLQKLLGHSRITETMIYAHVSEAKKEEQMRKFEEALD